MDDDQHSGWLTFAAVILVLAGIMKVFDSGDNVAVGTTKLFHAALAAGNYVLVCNLPGHYKAGMHTAFTVTGTPVDGGSAPATA